MIRKQRRPLARHLIDRLLFRPPKLDAGDASERGIVELLALVHHDSGKQDSLSALGLAAAVGYPDMVQALLDAGTNHALRAMEGSTALLISLQGGFMGRAEEYEKITRLLLDVGADPTDRDERGRTVLMFAAAHGHEDVVRLALEAGVDVNATEDQGMTALFAASSTGQPNTARLLIEAGADVNVQDHEGKTALAHATEGGHEAVVALLKEAGARE